MYDVFESIADTLIIFSCTSPFLLQKNSLKMLNCRLLVANFSKACALTSRNYVSKPDLSIIIALLSFCFKRKAWNMIICRIYLPLKETFNFRLLSRRCVHSLLENSSWRGYFSLSKTLKYFWSHSSLLL